MEQTAADALPGRREGAVPEWIAWTPSGLYDAGGRQIEARRMAFQPGGVGKPVQFAKIEQYRDAFQERQLLGLLMKHADLGDARAAIDRLKAIAPPQATLQVNGPGLEKLAEDGFLARRPG
jgi:hypothetical protein